MGWQSIDDWMSERGFTERTRVTQPWERTAPAPFGHRVAGKAEHEPRRPSPGHRTTARRGVDGDEVAAGFHRGEGVRELMHRFDVSEATIRHHLRRRGITSTINRRRTA